MSAFEELRRNGQFGRAGLALLGELMRQEARRMPVLGGVTDDRVDDLVQSFFVDRGASLTVQAFAAGVADPSATGSRIKPGRPTAALYDVSWSAY